MAGLDVTKALRVPGKLIKDPAQVTPGVNGDYGGTILGIVNEPGVRFLPNWATVEVTAEEFGAEPCDSIYMGEAPIMGASLRSWEDDVIAAVWPSTSVGGSSGDVGVDGPGTFRAGTSLSRRAFALLFAPFDTNHPAVYFPSAIPALEETAELRFGNEDSLQLDVVFFAIRDASGRLYEIKPAEDLTL